MWVYIIEVSYDIDTISGPVVTIIWGTEWRSRKIFIEGAVMIFFVVYIKHSAIREVA